MTTPAASRQPSHRRFAEAAAHPDAFDHAEHIRLAFEMLCDCGVTETLGRYSAGLRTLTETLGVPGKYHETVTGFLILLIAERRQADPDAGFDEFRSQNADLFGDVRRLLQDYYSKQRLDSMLARRQFLLPDKAPGRRQS